MTLFGYIPNFMKLEKLIMNSMLKKTLLAASVAATFGVNAAVIQPVDTDAMMMGTQLQVISAEGFAIVESIGVGTGADEVLVQVLPEIPTYFQSDILEFVFTGATVDENVSLSTVQLRLASDDTVVAQALEVSDNVVSFVLIDTAAGNTGFDNPLLADAGVALYVDGITLSEVAGPVSASYSIIRGDRTFDSAASTAVVTIGSQFAATVAEELNGVVDVENDRQTFVGGGVSDSFGLTLASTADLLTVTPTDAAITIAGEDLTFLVDEEGDLLASQVGVALNANTVTTTDSVTEDGLVVVELGVDVTGTTTVTLSNSTDEDAPALVAPQSFTADFGVDYELTTNAASTGSIAFNGLDIGAWSLNGATLNVPYMPFGSGITQILYVSNDSDVDGMIEVSALSSTGEVMGPVALNITATAQTVTNIGSATLQALSEAGIQLQGARLDLTFTITAPTDSIELFAAYNSRGDRLAVPVTKN